jgi:hypothetical protein
MRAWARALRSIVSVARRTVAGSSGQRWRSAVHPRIAFKGARRSCPRARNSSSLERQAHSARSRRRRPSSSARWYDDTSPRTSRRSPEAAAAPPRTRSPATVTRVTGPPAPVAVPTTAAAKSTARTSGAAVASRTVRDAAPSGAGPDVRSGAPAARIVVCMRPQRAKKVHTAGPRVRVPRWRLTRRGNKALTSGVRPAAHGSRGRTPRRSVAAGNARGEPPSCTTFEL